MATELATAYISLVPSAKGIQGKIAGELAGAGEEGARATESAFGRHAGKVKDTFTMALKGAAVLGGAAFGAAALGAKAALGAANDYQESLSKIDAVFGAAEAARIEQWAEGAAEGFGQSRAQAVAAAGDYGNLLTSFGLTQDAASGMSTNMVQLASDLASFNNTSPEEALQALRSGLTGETEPLKRFGIALDDASLKQKALALGISDGTSTLTPAQKAQAAYALILERSANAQGDFARTSDGAANQQRMFAARLEDVKLKVGQALLPALNAILPVISDLIGAIETVISVFQEDGLAGVFDLVKTKWEQAWPAIQSTLSTFATNVWDWISAQVPVLVGKLGEWAAALVEWVLPQIPPLLEEVGKLVGALLTWVIDEGLPMLVEKLKELGLAFVQWIGPQIPPLLLELGKLLWSVGDWILTDALPKLAEKLVEWAVAFAGWVLTDAVPWLLENLAKLREKLTRWIVEDAAPAIVEKAVELAKGLTDWAAGVPETIFNLLKGLPGRVADATDGMWDGIKDAFRAAINWLIDKWNDFSITIGGGSFLGQDIPEMRLDTPDIPRFHDGGVVPGRPGQEVLAVLQAGEQVLTAEQRQTMGASGGNVWQINADGLTAAEAEQYIPRAILHAQMLEVAH